MIKILLRNFLAKYFKRSSKYWPVSHELMAQYLDGSHTKECHGSLWWTKNNQLHRDGDKPAAIYSTGGLEWRKNGNVHRDNDKPAIIRADGTLEWFQNGERHRDGDLPAIIRADGSLWWMQNDLRHRFSGPAVIYLSGICKWWIKGKNITQEVNEWLAGEEWHGTPEQIVEFQLRFT